MGFRIGVGKKIGGVYVGLSKNIGGKKSGKGGTGCLMPFLYLILLPFTVIYFTIKFIVWAVKVTKEQLAEDPDNVWYKRTWGILLLLFLFFPVGAYLLWKYSPWGAPAKAIITGAFALTFIAALASPGSGSNSDAKETGADPAASVTESVTTPPAESTVETDVTTGSTAITETEPTSTQAPQTTPAVKETQPPKKETLSISSVSSPVSPNANATLRAKGAPNTEYSISVKYSSGESSAKGLENKKSDASGNVAWTWKVSQNTKAGTYKITVRGGGETVTTTFTVK